MLTCALTSCATHAAIPERTRAGRDLDLSHDVKQPLRSAALHIRSGGSRAFRQIAVPVTGGSTLQVRVPAGLILAPDVELYLSWVTADGRTGTYPETHPDYKPLKISVITGGAASVSAATLEGSRLILETSEPVDAASVRASLDGVDISNALSIDEQGRLIYEAPQQLEARSYPLQVQFGEQTAQTLSVDGASTAPDKSGQVVVRGSSGLDFGGNLSNSADSSNDTSANLSVDVSASKHDWNYAFSGVDLQYVDGSQPAVSISSGYLLTAENANQRYEVGDISFSGTSLVASGFSRRGVQTAFRGEGWETQLFSARSNPVTGNTAGLGFDRDRQTLGMNTLWTLPTQTPFTLQTTVISGGGGGGGAGVSQTVETDLSGDAYGARLGGQMFGNELEAEFGYASTEEQDETGRVVRDDSDSAWLASAGRDVFGVNVRASAQHYGSRYSTIADTGSTGDRESYDLSLAGNLGVLSWSLSGADARDNVDDEADRPQVTSRSGAASLGFAVGNWPSLNLSLSRAQQDSAGGPADAEQVDNVNDQVTVQTGYTLGPASLSLSAALGELRDALPGSEQDADTRNYSVFVNFNHGRISLAPGYTYSETLTRTRDDLSHLFTLSLSLPLWTEALTLGTQASFQTAESSDGSSNGDVLNLSSRMAFSLADILKRKIPEWLNLQLALSVDYNNVTGNMPERMPGTTETTTVEELQRREREQDDVRVLLGFSLGAPLNFEFKRPF